MVSLDFADKKLRLRVEDDGVGFPAEQVLLKSDSFGVAGMKERVALFGGRLVIRSGSGQGTKVLAELPLP